MATLAAVKLGDALESAGFGALTLLIGFVLVVAVLDLIMTGAIPKWAIFAPVFVPLLMRLDVDPEAVLAAYRVGDSPINAVSPLNAYFALIVSFAQKYDPKAGVGTVIALMLPYVVIVLVLWIMLLGLALLGFRGASSAAAVSRLDPSFEEVLEMMQLTMLQSATARRRSQPACELVTRSLA